MFFQPCKLKNKIVGEYYLVTTMPHKYFGKALLKKNLMPY